MSQLPVADIIKIGDISTYLSAKYIEEGKAYGDRLSQDMSTTIAMVTDALRWQWAAFPDVAEVRAQGTITIDALGDEGDNIAVFVNDPSFGIIQLGNWTQALGDTTTSILAQNLFLACSANTYGYQCIYVPGNNNFTIIGREGSGALINNANNLFVVITPTPVEFICAETGNRLLTQQPTITYITTETY